MQPHIESEAELEELQRTVAPMPPSAEVMIVAYNTARRVLEAAYKAVSETDPSAVEWSRLHGEWCRAGKIAQIREGQLRLHAERLERMRSDARHTVTYTDHMGVTHTSRGPQVCTYGTLDLRTRSSERTGKISSGRVGPMGDRDETRSKKGVIVFVKTGLQEGESEGIDLDVLDRLHASLPELEPTSWLDADENDTAVVIATVGAEDDYDVDVAAERAHDAVTILRAYPALSAEVRALRKVSQDRYAEAIADVVAWLRRKSVHGDVLDRVITGIEDCAHVGEAKKGDT